MTFAESSNTNTAAPTPVDELLQDLVVWANEHIRNNDKDKDDLVGELDRDPKLINNPAILAKLGATAATELVVNDLLGFVVSRANEQLGNLDRVPDAFLESTSDNKTQD